jgi:hypothetical protein
MSDRRFLLIACLSVALLAFALRAAFNLAVCDHRFCDAGDPYFFQVTATGILKILHTPHWWSNLGELLGKPQADQLGAVLSERLADRILLDGPAFPAYLAICQTLFCLNLQAPNYAAYAQSFAVVNSLLDALVGSIVVALTFNIFKRRFMSLFAGLLYAFYIPAIVSTPLCYSEQFAQFVLALWFLLVLAFADSFSRKVTSCKTLWLALALGGWSAVLMLAKPSFAFLPWLCLGAALALNHNNWLRYLNLRCLPAYLTAFAGLVLTLSPWLYLTKLLTGKMALTISRVPGYNLSMGNQIHRDGWVSYTPELVQIQFGEALSHLLKQMGEYPLAYLSLYLRKIFRLWLSPWNDFNYQFLVGTPLINTEHVALLLASLIGIILVLSHGGRNSEIGKRTKFKAFLLLTLLLLFHFSYLPFVAMSRYCFSASFLLCPLAAAGLFLGTSPQLNTLRMRLLAIALFLGLAGLTSHSNWFNNQLANLALTNVPVYYLARSLWPLSICLTAVWAWFTVLKLKPGRLAGTAISLFVLVLLASSAADLLYPTSLEFSRFLEEKESLVCDLKLSPLQFKQDEGFLLIDAQAPSLTPDLQITVNNKVLETTFLPWWQLSNEAPGFLKALDFQANFEGLPKQSYRQWWLVPVQTKDFSKENKLRFTANSACRLWGTAPTLDSYRGLPSLRHHSWAKGVSSYDKGDCRIFELRSDGQDGQGKLHVYFLTAGKAMGAVNWAKKPFWQISHYLSTGSMPLSTRIELGKIADCKTDFELGSRSELVNFQASLKAKNKKQLAALAFLVSGYDHSRQVVTWQSTWFAGQLPLTSEAREISINEILPQSVSALKNRTVTLVISPFTTDQFFLKRKACIHSELNVEKAQVTMGTTSLREASLSPCELTVSP